jgi:hypothetical protein
MNTTFDWALYATIAAHIGVLTLLLGSSMVPSKLAQSRWLMLGLLGLGSVQSLRALGGFFFERDGLAERARAAVQYPHTELTWLLRELDQLPFDLLMVWTAGLILGAASLHVTQVWRLDATIARLQELKGDPEPAPASSLDAGAS